MSTVLVPGTFDPITLGHVEMIRHAARQFDLVVVSVMVQNSKINMFSPEERLKMAEISLCGIDRVKVIIYDGMTADLYREVGADAMYRGIRNEQDVAWENKILAFHKEHNPDLKTLFWQAPDNLVECSSTAIREALEKGIVRREFLAPRLADYLEEKLRRKAE